MTVDEAVRSGKDRLAPSAARSSLRAAKPPSQRARQRSGDSSCSEAAQAGIVANRLPVNAVQPWMTMAPQGPPYGGANRRFDDRLRRDVRLQPGEVTLERLVHQA